MKITLGWWVVPVVMFAAAVWCLLVPKRSWEDLALNYIGAFLAVGGVLFMAGMCAGATP